MKLSTKLLLKCAEECSEAAAALLQFVNKANDDNPEQAKDLREAFSKELGDVSTFLAILLQLEVIDNKVYWANYDAKTEKWTKRVEAMLEEAKKASDDSSK